MEENDSACAGGRAAQKNEALDKSIPCETTTRFRQFFPLSSARIHRNGLFCAHNGAGLVLLILCVEI